MLFACFVYLKKKYGFWIIQPVFHVYDIGYMFFPPGIIDVHLPEKNKFTNFKNIETSVYQECSDIQMDLFKDFICSNYLQNKNNIFSPKLENIEPYFKGQNHKSFFTFYKEPCILWDTNKQSTISHETIIGVITGRSVCVSIKDGEPLDAYYVDYLCVDKNNRKRGIAPQLIQTHHYNQRYLNKKIMVSLFKREEVLTGIVPLCVYDTYGFSVNNWAKPLEVNGVYKLVEVNMQNIHMLYDFMKRREKMFEITICSHMSNIIELIKTNNIFIQMMLEEGEVVSAYFYRKTCVLIEDGLEVLSCFASINYTEEDKFIQGFKSSFWKICEKYLFGFAALENISHNYILIENLKLKTFPTIISPTAYFFYNFAYPTFNSSKVFVLN
jgi:hypothetical protein